MAVTIYDVAKKAGVGIGTVSRAINNSPQINPQTKDRVLRIIQEMKYQPHALAQSLARKKSFTIAGIVPYFSNYVYFELFKSVQKAILLHHYGLVLYSVDHPDQLSDTLDRVVADRRSDGVLLISIGLEEKQARKFIETPVPVVLLAHKAARLDSFFVANEPAARCAVEHLISLGHTHIGMVSGTLTEYPGQERFQGYKAALQTKGLSFNERWLVVCEAEDEDGGGAEQAAYRAMQRTLKQGTDLPTAFFVASDAQALGVLRAAKEAGVRIPEDLSIVGFDDNKFSKFVGLTTIHQPIAEMGVMAVERLIQRIETDSEGGLHQELPATLIVRETCGAHAGFKIQS